MPTTTAYAVTMKYNTIEFSVSCHITRIHFPKRKTMIIMLELRNNGVALVIGFVL